MKILLVDDNQTANFYNGDVVDELGLFSKVDILSTGREAIEFFERIKEGEESLPDVILLDIKIPDYDGFEILDELEELDIEGIGDTLVCMLTTSEHKRDIESYEKSYLAKEYIQKPLDKDHLYNILKKHGLVKE